MSLNLDERAAAALKFSTHHRHTRRRRRRLGARSTKKRVGSVFAASERRSGRDAGGAPQNRPTRRLELLERQGQGRVSHLGLPGADRRRGCRQAEQIKGFLLFLFAFYAGRIASGLFIFARLVHHTQSCFYF